MPNFPRIFNDTSVTSSIPIELPHLETPSEIYTVEKSIKSKISSFNSFSGTTPSCHAIVQILVFKIKTMDTYWPAISGLLITTIWENLSQMNRIKRTNFKKTKSDLVSSLNSCKASWCNKHGIHKFNLKKWKQNILTLAGDTILETPRQPKANTFPMLKEHFIL